MHHCLPHFANFSDTYRIVRVPCRYNPSRRVCSSLEETSVAGYGSLEGTVYTVAGYVAVEVVAIGQYSRVSFSS